MLAHLLKNKKKSPKTKGKKKEVESFSSEDTKREKHLNPKSPKPSSEEEDNSESGSRHYRRMNNLEKHLEALTRRGDLQDVGVVRPYQAEWDIAPYPPRFKAPTRHTFDSKGSPNQHMYYFKSQTGNIVSNDAIMARLLMALSRGLPLNGS